MNEEGAGEIKRILVAVDGSEQSHKAIRLASKIARSLGAEVTLLYVMEMKDMPTLIAEAEVNGLEQRGQNILMDGAEIALGEGVETKTKLLRGHPADQIIHYASEHHPQMVFIGTRGLGMGASLVMGSVSKAVVQRAKCSVVVVR